MPLLPGKENVGRNISELGSTGKFSQKQAVAIAMSVKREAEKKSRKKR